MSTASSPPMDTSELPLSTAVDSVNADVSTTESQNVPCDHLTTHDLTEPHSGPEHELQTFPPEASVMECAITVTEIESNVVKESEETKTTECNEQSESSIESEKTTEEPAVDSSEVIVQDNEEMPKEETVELNDIAEDDSEASKGTSDDCCGDEIMNGDQKQHEMKSCDEK